MAGLGPMLFQLPDYQMIEKCGVPNSAELPETNKPAPKRLACYVAEAGLEPTTSGL